MISGLLIFNRDNISCSQNLLPKLADFLVGMVKEAIEGSKLSSELLQWSYRETCMGSASYRWRELFV